MMVLYRPRCQCDTIMEHLHLTYLAEGTELMFHCGGYVCQECVSFIAQLDLHLSQSYLENRQSHFPYQFHKLLA